MGITINAMNSIGPVVQWACYLTSACSLVNITNCHFYDNAIVSNGNSGGAIGISVSGSNTIISITNSRFVNNTALPQPSSSGDDSYGGGGFIEVTSDAQGVLANTTVLLLENYFQGNSANHGGALYLYLGGFPGEDVDVVNTTVLLTDSLFMNNNATVGSGGALYARTLTYSGDVIQSNFTFSNITVSIDSPTTQLISIPAVSLPTL